LIASRIAMKEIAIDKEAIRTVLNQLLEEGQTTDEVIIRLSNEDFSFIEQLRETLRRPTDPLKRVRLEATDDVTSGGCLMETRFGTIDATVEERVSRVTESVYSKMPRHKKDDENPTGEST